MNQLLRLSDVMRATGLSRSTIYLYESRGEFPRRVKLTPKASAWRADEIEKFINSRPRASEPQPNQAA